LIIQPPAGQEWTIHNIKYGGAVNIHTTDGVLDLPWDSDTGPGARLGYNHNVTNAYWLEIENVSGGDVVMGYDGVLSGPQPPPA